MTKEKVGKRPLRRGAFGYITEKKKSYLKKTILYILIGLIIFVVGYFLNKRSTANVFTVLAILMVLPGAKAVVAWIVFFPFQSVGKERYEKVYEVLARKVQTPRSMSQAMVDTKILEDILQLYTDVVFTSPQKVMNLDFLVVSDHRILALAGKEKQDLSYMETYLKEGLLGKKSPFGVKIYDNADQFMKAVQALEIRETTKESRVDTVEYLESLIVV